MAGLLQVELPHRAQQALRLSPVHALRDLRVDQQGKSLVISGSVSSFYYKQLAQEVVRTVDRTVDIVNVVRVD